MLYECIIFSTKNVNCASEIVNWSEFLGMSIRVRVVWENITNKFLIVNIRMNIPLAELGQETEVVNSLKIIELRSFIRKVSLNKVSPFLVSH